MTHGDQLRALCEAARGEIVLAAPFIKAATLSKLITAIQPGVKLRCITRWRPEEIAAGVSDLEVWPLLRDREHCTLLLRPDLHAKYYRIDDSCLVGSANLTATALGWAREPNLELLVALSADVPSLVAFEAAMLSGCVAVTDDLWARLRAVTDALVSAMPQLA